MEVPTLIGAGEAVSHLHGWAALNGRDAITKSFRFATFEAAFAFMSEVAIVAVWMQHTPEWTNIAERVDIVLSTGKPQGVTDKDLNLAFAIEAAAKASLPNQGSH